MYCTHKRRICKLTSKKSEIFVYQNLILKSNLVSSELKSSFFFIQDWKVTNYNYSVTSFDLLHFRIDPNFVKRMEAKRMEGYTVKCWKWSYTDECHYGDSTFNTPATVEFFTTIICNLISLRFNFVNWSIC